MGNESLLLNDNNKYNFCSMNRMIKFLLIFLFVALVGKVAERKKRH